MTEHDAGSRVDLDVRPTVAPRTTNRGLWLFAGGLGMAGILLFQSLETRRAQSVQPTVLRPGKETGEVIASPPLPDLPFDQTNIDDGGLGRPDYWQQRPRPQGVTRATLAPPQQAQLQPRARAGNGVSVISEPTVAPSTLPAWQSPQTQSLGAATPPKGSSYTGPKVSANDSSTSQANGRERVEAVQFANPGSTVPKGTVIQAVLETALDSTRPGFARAIVSRDVYAFDGSRVLIPRGSRLIGEYKADVAIGQKRALIQWQRLMRPDGVLVDLDSPAADPLGRAGVGGKVKTHFFERFAGSILQSTLDIGVQLATQRLSRQTYILALPGTTQGLISNQGEKIAPTIIVRQGSSVSVFVARDLDFTVVNQ